MTDAQADRIEQKLDQLLEAVGLLLALEVADEDPDDLEHMDTQGRA